MYLRLSRLCLALLLGGLQKECGFVCVHCTRWLLVALDGGETENWIVGGFLQCILQSPQSAEISVRAPFLRVSALLSLGHSLGAVPAPGGTARLCFTDCGALFFKNRKLVAPQSVPYGFRFPENLLCKERKKHFPDPPKKRRLPLGAGHLTSLRARVSRCSSGQKPTWRKSSWHSTKTPSA